MHTKEQQTRMNSAGVVECVDVEGGMRYTGVLEYVHDVEIRQNLAKKREFRTSYSGLITISFSPTGILRYFSSAAPIK